MIKLGVLSDEFISLMEFEEKSRSQGGKLTESEIRGMPFEYLKTETLNTLVRKKALDRVVNEFQPNAPHHALNYAYCITNEGHEALKKGKSNRKSYFNIRSERMKRALWCVLGGLSEGCSSFERQALIAHNGLHADNKLTRAGERFAFKALPEFLKYFLQTYAWTLETGPNISLYTGSEWYSAPLFTEWKKALKADFTLLKSIKGIGVSLMDRLDPSHKSYAKLLLTATTPERAIAALAKVQRKNPNAFIFCNIKDEDMAVPNADDETEAET